MLTDGRGNIARSGLPGREAAQADALTGGGVLAAEGIAAALIDTAPRPRPEAAALAAAMGGATWRCPGSSQARCSAR